MLEKGRRYSQNFRTAARTGPVSVQKCVDELRRAAAPSEYGAIIAGLKSFAPMQSSLLFATGTPRFELLVWRPTLEQMPLDRELEWAAHWLKGSASKINKFRKFAGDVQELLLNSSEAEALAKLDQFVGQFGWTLWYAELRCALEQYVRGNDAQKAWSTKLQRDGSGRISGLLAHIFSERNEEAFSYDSFYSKCVDSFPRFKTNSNWLPRYLLYRALGHVDAHEQGLPTILAREASSSLIDYYEALVDVIRSVIDQKELSQFRAAAANVIRTLLADGYVDHRLQKLSIALGGCQEIKPASEPEPEGALRQFADFIAGRADEFTFTSGMLAGVPENLKESARQGIVAASSISSLLKVGLNLRSLDIGLAVAMASQQGLSDLLTSRVTSIESALLSAPLYPEDVPAFPDATGRALLRRIADESMATKAGEVCRAISKVLDGAGPAIDLTTPVNLHLWLGRQLLLLDRFGDAFELGERLEEIGGHWRRQGAKLKLWALIKHKRTQEALKLSASWILDDPRYTVELPVAAVFDGIDWACLRDIDPELVGLISHHAYVATSDARIGYICKMACRQFAMSGARARVVDEFKESSDGEWKRLIIAFLRDVWIEENLSMNHLLDSTELVADERMEVYQILLEFDPEGEEDYIEAIKTLTFDQTIRKGLKHIDQTRVFVNESAITRWAEKELSQDFERWQSINESSPSANLDDELVRQYVVGSQNEDFLRELSDGKPTEADVLLANVLERLFRRFLTDPTDGLDCFLSLRIRHGSLKGTLFGPLEEHGLVYTLSDSSRVAFDERWSDIMPLSQAEKAKIIGLMESFCLRIKGIADELINERVQIRSQEKPLGAISQYVVPVSGRLLNASLKGQKLTFNSFTYIAYFVFWEYIKLGLAELALYVRENVKDQVRREAEVALDALRAYSYKTVPLLTALTTVATAMQAQCDVIADWFQAPSQSKGDQYKLSVAIEIARTATKRVHRAFPAEIRGTYQTEEDPPLSTAALSALSDSLFVIFENAWKYSGLGPEIGALDVIASLDVANGLLTLRVENNLSADVLRDLIFGQLDELKERYLSSSTLERASREGGSGFAKLSRMSRYVDRSICASPLDFGISHERWFTVVTIPLFERNGVYETY